MKTLVMFSGGIDSAYRAAQLITETTDAVHLHHINIINRTKRHELEKIAVMALLGKLERIRPITYSESTVDHSQHSTIAWDMTLVCFEAGICVKNSKTLAETDASKNSITHWTIGTHKKEGHWLRRWAQIHKLTKLAMQSSDIITWPSDAPIFSLGKLISKKEEMKYLNNLGLLKDCWYCRTPRHGNACGGCATCKEVSFNQE